MLNPILDAVAAPMIVFGVLTYILIALVGILLIAAVIVIICIIVKNKKKSKQKNNDTALPGQ